MPPKKKPGKDGKKEKAEQDSENKERIRSEKELILQKQLDDLTMESNQLRGTLEVLRKDNHFLREEANKSVEAATEYSLYMKSEAERRRNDVLSVNQKNQKDIAQLDRECEVLTVNFNKQLTEMTNELESKKVKLAEAKEKLASLDHVTEKEKLALQQINDLEKNLEETRTKHSQEIQQMKADFLKEKRNFTEETDNDVLALSKRATEIATICLNQHAERVQKENQKLRTELLALLSESEQLQQRKQQLEQQYLSLTRENEYLDDLQNMRVK